MTPHSRRSYSGTDAPGFGRDETGRPNSSRRIRRKSPRCHGSCAPGPVPPPRCPAPRPRAGRRSRRFRGRSGPGCPTIPDGSTGRATRVRWCTAGAECREWRWDAGLPRKAACRRSAPHVSTSKAPQWLDVTYVFSSGRFVISAPLKQRPRVTITPDRKIAVEKPNPGVNIQRFGIAGRSMACFPRRQPARNHSTGCPPIRSRTHRIGGPQSRNRGSN